MKANILNGRLLADQLKEKLRNQVETFKSQGLRSPHLVVILVGNNPPSEIYVANKRKASETVGIQTQLYRFDATISEQELLDEIAALNRNEEVDGILVQLPLPSHINAHNVLLEIDPQKDVDGFHPYNMGQLALKMPGLRPATPKGVILMLNHYIGEVIGMNAVVIGSSNIVGRPMALELLNQRATVTVCHSKTQNLAEITRQADILVAAVGVPHFIDAEYVKPGVIVVDVGINRLSDGKLQGDVDFEAVSKIASWISPVPGGVGPMTILGLLDNTLKAFEMRMER